MPQRLSKEKKRWRFEMPKNAANGKRDDPQIMDLRERQKRGGHMRQFWLGRAGQQVSIVVGRCGRMIYSELASGPDDDVPAKQMLSDQR